MRYLADNELETMRLGKRRGYRLIAGDVDVANLVDDYFSELDKLSPQEQIERSIEGIKAGSGNTIDRIQAGKFDSVELKADPSTNAMMKARAKEMLDAPVDLKTRGKLEEYMDELYKRSDRFNELMEIEDPIERITALRLEFSEYFPE